MKNWSVLKLNKDKAKEISASFDVPPIIAMLLDIRGITSEESIYQFLSDDNELIDPYLMTDMEKAVNRINKALNDGEKICIYGDYDADGVTSTALLYSYLDGVGADVMYYIPSRDSEGYGLNTCAIDKINEYEVKLIITVDNGVSAILEIDYANELGIDTVITDHHRTPAVLPNAVAVVNPHRPDCDYPFKELSGVGVVFKLLMALEDENLDVDLLLKKYSDITAMGTIGDIVSLTGENRIIVKYGLQSINNLERLGIKELLDDAGLKGNKISAGRLSFTLVPRINACGRLGLSEKSVKLLLTEDAAVAKEIAAELGEDNRLRQDIEREILEKIKSYIQDNPTIKAQRIIVISGENWHAGVIGIVASRLKEIYGKPVIVITWDENGAKGSGRSIKGFSLIDAITSCSDLLSHFGGHPMAAGLSLDKENINEFTIRINQYAKGLGKMPLPVLEIDCKLNPSALSVDMAQQLTALEPFGAGNPTPLFGLYNMTLKSIIPIGGGKHLRLVFTRGDTTIEALMFGTAKDDFPYIMGDVLDLAVTIDVNVYNGKTTLSIILRDIKFTSQKMDKIIESLWDFEALVRGEDINDIQRQSLLPIRDEFASVFRFLRQHDGWHYSASVLYTRLNNTKLTYGKLMTILYAISELSLIELKENSGKMLIKLLPFEGKVDLQSAEIIKKLVK